MKKSIFPSVLACLVLLGALAFQSAVALEPLDKNMILFDFETGTDGWKVDWGCSLGGPNAVTGEAHHGKSAVSFGHHFENQQEASAGVVVFQEPKNFTGYKTISAWVYFPPKTYDWQAQIYVRSGEGRDPAFGKLEQGLKAGWHQVKIDAQDIPDIANVKEIGVQVKNYTIDREMTFQFDQVEALPK